LNNDFIEELVQDMRRDAAEHTNIGIKHMVIRILERLLETRSGFFNLSIFSGSLQLVFCFFNESFQFQINSVIELFLFLHFHLIGR
jgi:hypothetical protein